MFRLSEDWKGTRWLHAHGRPPRLSGGACPSAGSHGAADGLERLGRILRQVQQHARELRAQGEEEKGPQAAEDLPVGRDRSGSSSSATTAAGEPQQGARNRTQITETSSQPPPLTRTSPKNIFSPQTSTPAPLPHLLPHRQRLAHQPLGLARQVPGRDGELHRRHQRVQLRPAHHELRVGPHTKVGVACGRRGGCRGQGRAAQGGAGRELG